MSSTASARGSAPARAALLGNPSDGYHGATLAVAVRDFRAEVEAMACAAGGPEGDPEAARPEDALLAAARRRFTAETGLTTDGIVLRATSSIPREVGLAGSSAIVTAAVRALCARHGVVLPPARLAGLVLAAETEELGIEAGLQDRVVQAYEGLVFMDFDAAHMAAHGHGRYEPLDPALLPPLFLAYRPAAAAASGHVHGDLRARHERGDAGVRATMAEIAMLAHRGRAALLSGDHAELGRLMDANVDLRRRLVTLDPRHLRMVDAARSLGLTANYAGSGGAIVGIATDAGAVGELARTLAAEGCVVLRPDVGPGNRSPG